MNTEVIVLFVCVLCFVMGSCITYLVTQDRNEYEAEQRARMPSLTPMAEEERVSAYLQGPGHPLAQAVLADLDELIVRTSDSAVGEELTERQERYRLGQQDGLMAFHVLLDERLAQARKTAERLEAETAEELGEKE